MGRPRRNQSRDTNQLLLFGLPPPHGKAPEIVTPYTIACYRVTLVRESSVPVRSGKIAILATPWQ